MFVSAVATLIAESNPHAQATCMSSMHILQAQISAYTQLPCSIEKMTIFLEVPLSLLLDHAKSVAFRPHNDQICHNLSKNVLFCTKMGIFITVF